MARTRIVAGQSLTDTAKAGWWSGAGSNCRPSANEWKRCSRTTRRPLSLAGAMLETCGSAGKGCTFPVTKWSLKHCSGERPAATLVRPSCQPAARPCDAPHRLPTPPDSLVMPSGTHRWVVVRMHKVNQWYPSLGQHRVCFRGPYMKGPRQAAAQRRCGKRTGEVGQPQQLRGIGQRHRPARWRALDLLAGQGAADRPGPFLARPGPGAGAGGLGEPVAFHAGTARCERRRPRGPRPAAGPRLRSAAAAS